MGTKYTAKSFLHTQLKSSGREESIMRWIVKMAAMAALMVGGYGMAGDIHTDYPVNGTLGGSGNGVWYFSDVGQTSAWDNAALKTTAGTNIYIGSNSIGGLGVSDTLAVKSITIDDANLTIVRPTAGTAGIGVSANTLVMDNTSKLTIRNLTGDEAGGGNNVTVNTLRFEDGNNRIEVQKFAALAVSGTATFGNDTSTLTLTGGTATFGGKVSSGNNTTFSLSDDSVIDFRQGLVIDGNNSSITSTSGANVAAFGNTGFTAGVTGAISIASGSSLSIIRDSERWDPGTSAADGTLKVTKNGAITFTTGAGTDAILHTGNYVVAKSVTGDLYTGTGIVNAASFTVEKGADAKGSATVDTTVTGQVDISGTYTLVSGASTTWESGATVTGVLKATGAGVTTIETGTDDKAVAFNVNGGTIETGTDGLELAARGGSGTYNLNFAGSTGSSINGKVQADDYIINVNNDLTFMGSGSSLSGHTYNQTGSSVLMDKDATGIATITTYDDANITKNSLLGVNMESMGNGDIAIDNTSGIDLRKGNLEFTGFANVKSDGYLYLGADTSNIYQLNIDSADAEISHNKIQMDDSFVKLYYNKNIDIENGGDNSAYSGDSNHFVITNGNVTNGNAAWTVSNVFGDFTFRSGDNDNGANGAWVEAYTHADVANVSAVAAQLMKNWDPRAISTGVATATSLAAQEMVGVGGFDYSGPNGQANYNMLEALALNNGTFDLGNGVTGILDDGLMAALNGAIASGPIYVAQDTFRDIATGLHSRLDAYRKVIEVINVNNGAIAAPAAYGSLGLASVDRYMNRFWAGGFGSWQNAKARNGFDGYKYDGAGVSLGYDRAFGAAILGASFTYVEGNYEDNSAISNDSKIKQYVTNLYATYNGTSGFFATVMGGYNYSDNDMREVRGGLQTSRDYHTHTFYAGGRLGYDIEPGDNLSVSPSVGADFFWSKSSQYDIAFDNAGVQPLHYGEMKNHNVEIPVEVKVAYDMNFGDNKTLTLMANGGYAYNLNDHAVWGASSLNGTPAPEIQAVGRQLGHHSWKGGAGIKFRMNNWDLGAKYDYQGRSNYSAHRLSAQIGYSF